MEIYVNSTHILLSIVDLAHSTMKFIPNISVHSSSVLHLRRKYDYMKAYNLGSFGSNTTKIAQTEAKGYIIEKYEQHKKRLALDLQPALFLVRIDTTGELAEP